jgi:ribonuclease D
MTVTNVRIVETDLSADFEWAARDAGAVAWDIETSGLDWRLDRIATCQVHVPEVGTQIVVMDGSVPERLRDLLTSERVTKVFHHAPFDLRFMRYHWKAAPRAVACTKILSKILRPDADPKEHSLKPVLLRYLRVEMDKTQQLSDWLAPELTPEQIAYAARDVEYLLPLLDRLMADARADGVADLAETTFAYLPTRVDTDIRGCGDVFSY